MLYLVNKTIYCKSLNKYILITSVRQHGWLEYIENDEVYFIHKDML